MASRRMRDTCIWETPTRSATRAAGDPPGAQPHDLPVPVAEDLTELLERGALLGPRRVLPLIRQRVQAAIGVVAVVVEGRVE